MSLERTAEYDFGHAAEAAATVAEAVLERGLPARTFININVPAGTPRGMRVTVQAKRNHVTVVAERLGSARPSVLLDRGRAERLGAARPLRLSRR